MYNPEAKENQPRAKRTKSTLPSTRVKALVEEKGYTYQMVERFIPQSRKRQDFLGSIDILAMKKGEKILGIQTFSTAWTEHERKIIQGESVWAQVGATLWLQLKNTRFIFIGWRKLKRKRGGTAVLWTPRFGKVILKKKVLKLIEVSSFEEAIK